MWKTEKFLFKTVYCTTSELWLCQNVVCSMQYTDNHSMHYILYTALWEHVTIQKQLNYIQGWQEFLFEYCCMFGKFPSIGLRVGAVRLRIFYLNAVSDHSGRLSALTVPFPQLLGQSLAARLCYLGVTDHSAAVSTSIKTKLLAVCLSRTFKRVLR